MRQKKTFQIFSFFMALLFLLQIAVPMKVYAADGQMVIAVSANSVEVGQTVTVTLWATGPGGARAASDMTFTYNADTFSFVSCSEESYSGGEGGQLTVSGTNVEVTLRAASAGNCMLQVSGSNGVVNDTQEALDNLSAAGVTISAVSQSGSGTGSTGNGSSDNSLADLSLSAGELSPVFSSSTLEYTATVPYETESVEVTATPAHEGASATVAGNQNLAVGENTVSVTVEAENGTTAVYEIIVTRLEQGAQTGVDVTQPGDTSQGEDPGSSGDGQAKEDESLTLEEAQHQISRLNEEYNNLDERYRAEKSFSRRVMAVMVFIIVVLLLVCINLLIARGRRGNREDGPEEDDRKEPDRGTEEKTDQKRKKPGLGSRLRDSFKEHEEEDWLDEDEEELEDEEDWLRDWPEDDGASERKKKSAKKPDQSGKQKPSDKQKKDSDQGKGKKGEIEVIDLDDF